MTYVPLVMQASNLWQNQLKLIEMINLTINFDGRYLGNYVFDISLIIIVENASMPGGMTWRRDCAMKGDSGLGCKDRDFHTPDGDIKVYECLCEGSKCNKYTDEETSTQKTTTTQGKNFS